jgi:hypothetical protein
MSTANQKRNVQSVQDLTKGFTLDLLRESQTNYKADNDEYIDVDAIFEKLIANAPAPVAVDADATLLAKLAQPKRKPLVQICSYEKAKRMVWTIVKRKCLDKGERYEDIVRRTTIMADVYENATKWAINDPSSAYPLGKCLFVYGMPGNGKTFLLEVLHELSENLGSEKMGPVLRTQEIQEAAILSAKSKSQNEVSVSKYARYCFDDMGIDQPYQHYGNMIDCIPDLIFVKYERWANANQINCFTSNYPLDPFLNEENEEVCYMKDRYGERAHSRLTQMCVPILMNYADWRKEKP